MKMIPSIIAASLLSLFCLAFFGALICAYKEKKNLILIFIFLFIGLFFFVVSLSFSNRRGVNTGTKIGIETALRDTLDRYKPVDDMAQLYGFAVLDKSYIKEKNNDQEPEKTKYYLKLEERIIADYPCLIFEKVETTKEIWDEVKVNKVYPSSKSAGLEE